MADRGIPLAHTTILRWIQYYLPEFEKRWSAGGKSMPDVAVLSELHPAK
jgi:transposase-like protein